MKKTCENCDNEQIGDSCYLCARDWKAMDGWDKKEKSCETCRLNDLPAPPECYKCIDVGMRLHEYWQPKEETMLKDHYDYTPYPPRPKEDTMHKVGDKAKMLASSCGFSVGEIVTVCEADHVGDMPYRLMSDNGVAYWIERKLYEFIKETPMKYEVIEAISARTILDKNPCEDAYIKYINVFGLEEITFGNFDILLEWAEKNRCIQWLIDNGFIAVVDDELKACPFHVGNNLVVIYEDDGRFFARCEFCYARGPNTTGKKWAIEAWNKRVV